MNPRSLSVGIRPTRRTKCSAVFLAWTCIGVVLAGAGYSYAAVQLPPVFSHHMVLQAGRNLPVWGTASPGEKVTVDIDGQRKSAVAGEDGKWTLTLDPLKAGATPTLSVQGSDITPRVISDVLVGEVWLCSGQSNMAFPVSKAKNAAEEIAGANWPKIRMFQPNSKWVVCSPQTAGAFSATAYYFGREIHQKTGAPVGLLNVSLAARRSNSGQTRRCRKPCSD